MEKIVAAAEQSMERWLPEILRLHGPTILFLLLIGAILYSLLAATYPPLHDAVHDFRHSLAIVPCH
jgi:hypothetical protein